MNRLFFLLIIIHGSLFGQNQIELNLTGTNPYPFRADSYLDEVEIITAVIANKTSQDQTLSAHVEILGPKGIKINSGMPICNIDIARGERFVFKRMNYNDLCLNFNDVNVQNVLNNSSLSVQEKNAFLLSRILPEGDYSYCMTLNDASTETKIVTTCLEFSIEHPDRPVIIQPLADLDVDGLRQPILNINWSHIVNDPRLRNSISYNLKIISMGDNNEKEYKFPSENEAIQMMDDPAIISFVDERDISYTNKSYQLTFNNFNFQKDHYYSIRVTVVSDDFMYPAGSSQSNVRIFKYSELDLECGNNVEVLSAYPLSGECIPFTSFGGICRISPYCDYTNLDYSSSLTGDPIINYSRKIKWVNESPKQFFTRVTGINDPDGYFSSHQISFSALDNLPQFKRGNSYSWSSNGTVTLDKKRIGFNLNKTTFSVGMPHMKTNEPKSGDTISLGQVKVGAIHDKIPSSPLPPFKFFQIKDKNVVGFGVLKVKETVVIQVSKEADFSSIITGYSKLIEIDDSLYLNKTTRMYDQSAFINDVYQSYDLKHEFTEIGKYYWRVGWLKNPLNELNIDQIKEITTDQLYNISIDNFIIGNKTSTNEGDTPINQSECISPCDLPAISNTFDILSLSVSDTIRIGKFSMALEKLNKSGNLYSGEGSIEIPFVRRVKLKVVFSNIKVNNEKVVYDGVVNGKKGGTEIKSLSTLILGSDMDLPFGIDTTIHDKKLTLAFTDYVFSSTQAFVEVNFNTEPILGSLGVEPGLAPILSTQICITPDGYAEDLIFHTTDDIVYQHESESGPGYGFELKGGADIKDTTSMTYFRYNCRGFHSFQLAGSVLLSQEVFLKDSGNSVDDEPQNETVKGEFKFKYVDRGSDWIITGRMADFQVKDVNGWGFDVDTFYIDISDAVNPPNFKGPEGYNASFFNNAEIVNTWKGLYMPKIKVLSPKNFLKDDMRTDFGNSSMIMGEGVYYIRHIATDPVSLDQGNLGRMKASVDKIDIVLSNIDFKFEINGKIKLPFVEESELLIYTGLYNGKDDYNFTLSVSDDPLTVPLWKSYMELNKESYFFLGRNNEFKKFTIKTSLHGKISLDKDLLGDTPGLKKIEMPGIAFQDIGYESGKGFTGEGTFAKASEQKTINGFPVSLDTIHFKSYEGHPGLYFKPRISLAGKEDGFSVAGGLVFYGKLDISKPHDIYNGIGVHLEDIEIDVDIASCTFKGYIKFFKTDTDDGIEGVLDATFPSGIAGKFKTKFGNYTSDVNAEFGTSANYNYWYADALIAFGKSGIPVFSGVNLYGVGGGMWYHMKQTDVKIKPASLYKDEDTSKSATPKPSGIGYDRDYSYGYGIKFQGLFGDVATGGDKFNMLLALQVQFTESGGLGEIKLRGDVFMMSKIEDIKEDGKVEETKKSLWGYAEFTYNHIDDFIDAQINVSAMIKVGGEKLLYGRGSDYSVVKAHFHASTKNENKWFFYVGTPEDRGGIVINAIVKKLDANCYFMMGQGVPGETPEPDPRFMAMLSDKNNSSYTSSQGNLGSILNKPINYTAKGIAFGSIVSTTDTFEFMPFYFSLSLILGMDINVTKDEERFCEETGKAPGHNNWYATGQMYAGLSGDFGIRVKFLFINVKKSLFYGSIATLMKGGLPNPSWFLCRGTLKYDIAGLVKGQHSFSMQIGDKCTLGNGNPFGDMELIQATNPEDKESDVSVFTYPSVTFAFAVGNEIELYDDQLKKTRILKLVIDKFELKEKKKILAYDHSMIAENYTAQYKPKSTLKGKTDHSFTIMVKAMEKDNEIWKPVYVDGKIWFEEKTINFKTGVKPDSIVDGQIDITYPMQGQRYFLKNETEGGKGFISLNQQDDVLFYKTKKVNVKGKIKVNSYKYVIEFIPLIGGVQDSIVEDLEIVNNQVLKFNVRNLANNTKYYALLKRINTTPENSTNYTLSAFTRSNANYNYEVIPARMVNLIANEGGDKENILFKYIFQTSKFSSFKEKMDVLNLEAPVYTSDNVQNIRHTYSGHTEDFDEYDIVGYKRSCNSDSSTCKSIKSMVQAGIFYVVGEDFFANYDFSFLGNDAILDDINKNRWWQARQYLSWKYALPGTTKTTVLSKVGKLQKFSLSMNADIYKCHYNMVRKPIKFPYKATSEVSNFTQETPQRKLNILANYGINGVMLNIKNVYALTDRMEAIGNIIKSNNIQLYNHINTYINSPTHFAFKMVPCIDSKFGLIYTIPTPTGKKITSRITIPYRTPGPCNEGGGGIH